MELQFTPMCTCTNKEVVLSLGVKYALIRRTDLEVCPYSVDERFSAKLLDSDSQITSEQDMHERVNTLLGGSIQFMHNHIHTPSQ